MRKSVKFLIPVLLVVAIVISGAVFFASAADKVVYVSSTGTGDGSSPTSPIGPGTVNGTITYTTGGTAFDYTGENAKGYYEAISELKANFAINKKGFVPASDCLTKASPLYRAFEAIGTGNTGTIIIMDELVFESADRMEVNSASEGKLPQTGAVTITSKDEVNGVDYGASGAKLVLDHSLWTSVAIQLGSVTTWKNIAIEYKYGTAGYGVWENSFPIYASCNSITIDEGVTVTSTNVGTTPASEGDRYPNIFGGARYSNLSSNGKSYITVKSGNWGAIFGAGHGMSGPNTGAIKAANITVSGGTVGEINGAGSDMRDIAYVDTDLTISVNGGNVGTITTETAKGVKGAIKVDVKTPATVGELKASDGTSGQNVPTSVEVTYEEGTIETVSGFEQSEVTEKKNAIFIASEAKGTGDGSSPENAMGNGKVTGTVYSAWTNATTNTPWKTYTDADYATVISEMAAAGKTLIDVQKVVMKQNALYRAIEALGGKSGTIVLVGPLSIDCAERNENISASEFILPTHNGTVTITSTFNNVDYSQAENGGAKMVFDRSNFQSVNLQLGGKTVWENLTIENRFYNILSSSGWLSNMMIFCSGYDTTFGDGIKSTSWTTDGNKAGGSYPYIFAGRRYGSVSANNGNQTITVNSGIWHGVGAAGHGMSSASHGDLTGNVTINIGYNGKGTSTNVVEFFGAGSPKRTTAEVRGNVTLNINKGGRIQDNIYVTSGGGISGEVTINIAQDAGITSTFKQILYTDGVVKSSNPTKSTLNFYKSVIPEEKVVNKSDFTVYNCIDGEGGGDPTPPSNVVYISSNGTGDGSTAATPLGNESGYDPNDATHYKKNAFYLAAEKLATTGGTIVVVGDVAIDTANRLTGSPAEFSLPATSKPIVVTSVYDGVDYRADAKLVFDLVETNTTFLTLNGAYTFEKLNIEHKYDPDKLNYWGAPFSIAANGKAFVIGEEVNVTSFNAKTNTVGDFFPDIYGGHRFSKITGNTSVTINSGTWGVVCPSGHGMSTDNTAAITGNATLIVNGGKINTIIGTSSLCREFATVSGTTTITINDGEVTALYGSAKNGNEGEIIVTINKDGSATTRVRKAWAYPGTGTAPGNAKITYSRAAIRDDEVKYWTSTTPVGDVSIQPDPPVITEKVIYVASNGTGDGSSPAAPLGNASNYDCTKIDSYNKSAIYLAMSALKENGGRIVVVGDLVFDTANARLDQPTGAPAEYPLCAANGKIVITSVYNGVDYRTTGAKIVFDSATCNKMVIEMKSDLTFEKVNIEHRYNNVKNAWGTPAAIAANGHEIVIGEEVNVTSFNVSKNAAGDFFPAIYGGHRFANITGDTNVTINSGTWSTVIAGSHGMTSQSKFGTITGNANLTINGGTITTVCGTSSVAQPTGTVTGTTTITVNGGKIGALFASADNGAENAINVTINSGATRVNKAWGGTKASPANATITYARNVIRDDEVQFWTNVNPVGDPSTMPEKEYYTVYVADVARGDGSGTSPENAIGATANWLTDYNWMINNFDQISAIQKIAAKDRTLEQTEFLAKYTGLYKESALYRALDNSTLLSQGGKVVLVGPVTINSNDSLALSNSNGDWNTPSGGSEVIITSVDKGVDYRTQGAKLVIDRTNIGVSVHFTLPFTIENIDIEYIYDSTKSTSAGTHSILWLDGRTGVFGEGINITPVDISGNNNKAYPSIVGGHRYDNAKYDTDITIKSGRWNVVAGGNWGRASDIKGEDGKIKKDENGNPMYNVYGYLDGNVNVLVTGGKITTLVGTTGRLDYNLYATATVKGDINIDVKGNAEIVKLYGANKAGAEGKITVNVTEDAYCGLAWGYYYTAEGAAFQPKDATINYVRSAIFEEDVKYWTTVNASGTGTPGVHGPVIYIATTSRGTGDGSSPENAMGNAANYEQQRQLALKYVADNGGSNSNLPADQAKVVGNVFRLTALYRALSQDSNAIIEEGGTIVVCDRYVLNAADGMRNSLSEFRWPATGTKTIKITSKYDGVDYRWNGARFVLDVSEIGITIETKSPTVWDDITIEHRYNSKNGTSVDKCGLIAAAGNKIVMGYNLSVVPVDINPEEDSRKELYPSICGGGRYQDFKTPTHVTVNGGQWTMVVGGSWTGTNTGSTTIGLGGGKVGTICGTGKPTGNGKVIGSTWIGLWGGEVDNVYGTGKGGRQWGSVAVGIGNGVTVNGKIYAAHPDYEGDDITAIAYYNAGAIDEEKLVGFTSINPQTGSPLFYLSAVAVVALVATGIVISKRRKRIED